ncbi:MAG: hypothetical protein KDA25_10115 [Phycisphaerales bacterium]|nr:hypothetical protein [Phycisphaerales bacterium]
MTGCLAMLTALVPAAATPAATNGPVDVIRNNMQRLDILNRPDELLDGLRTLPLVWGSVFVVVGILCVLNGYRWHKYVVMICALLAGIGLGRVLSDQLGESRVVVMAALGLLCAVIATPMLRFAVAIFAGMTGAFIGANVWTAVNQAPDAHLVGAAMGFVTIGLLSFILFRPVVMLFTSVGGAAMLVLGGITLLLQVPGWYDAVYDSLTSNHLIIPLLVAAAGVGGLVLQQSRPVEVKKPAAT